MPYRPAVNGAEKPARVTPVAAHLKRLMPGVDLRNTRARLWRACYERYLDRLGGLECIAPRDDAWARTLATLEMAMRDIEAAQVRGEPFDAQGYSLMVSRLERAERQIEAGRRAGPAKPNGDTRSRIMGAGR